MTTITATRDIPFSAEKVWAVLADFGNIQVFNPTVKKSYSHQGSPAGLGAKRHCDLLPFGAVEEEVVEWVDNERMVIDIYDGDKLPPAKDFRATIALSANGESTTVIFEVSYQMKLGFLGKMMNGMMIKSQFRKTAEKFLLGLEHYLKTGQKISSKEMKAA